MKENRVELSASKWRQVVKSKINVFREAEARICVSLVSKKKGEKEEENRSILAAIKAAAQSLLFSLSILWTY